jgi:hypothetical protein
MPLLTNLQSRANALARRLGGHEADDDEELTPSRLARVQATKARLPTHPKRGPRRPSNRAWGRWTNPSRLRGEAKPPRPSHRVH